jgi:DNA-binding SARP family transcriptional activator
LRLQLKLLGPFEVLAEGQPAAFATDRARALLTYLAVEAGRPHRRETLAGLLWSDRPEALARSNLSQALARLRRAIDDYHADPAFLRSTPKTIEFSACDVGLDVADFRDLIATAREHDHTSLEGCPACIPRLEQAAGLYRGDLAEGLSLEDDSLFEEWLLLNREQLRRQVMEVLYVLAHHYLERGDYERAQSYAESQLALEPWREEAHCQLMRALAASGQRSAALAQYRACRRLLNDELGVEPATETAELYDVIRAGALTPPMRSARSPSPGSAHVFVAREAEILRLELSLDGALAGRGQVALICGEVGSGKTALASEFSRRATARHPDLVAATGRCTAYIGAGDPYAPFRTVMAQLTRDVEAPDPAGSISADRASRLGALAPTAMAALAGRGPDLIDRIDSGTDTLPRTAIPDPAPRAGWLRQLEQAFAAKNGRRVEQGAPYQQLAAALQALAASRPLLLILDDLHWAGAWSLGLLSYLSQEIGGSRILLLGTYRPEEMSLGQGGGPYSLAAVVGELKRTFGEIEIDLDGEAGQAPPRSAGAESAGRRFVDAFLDSEPNRLEELFRQTLADRTRGQPLFTTELLREMRDRGDLWLDTEGRWVASPDLEWGHLPARVEAVIEQRLARLSPGLQAALRIACVEGVEFTAEVVARVQGLTEQQLIRRLSAEAVRRHRLLCAPHLQWAGSQPLSRYRFRHPLFRDYLYQTLDKAERLYLHRAVGRALAELHADQER